MELGHSELQMKFQSWWWRNLSKVCDEGTKVGWFQGVGWKIGVGDKARFWEDAWVDSNNPKTMFPRLYIIYLDQGKKVGEVGVWEESEWQWSLRWRLLKMEEASSLLSPCVCLMKKIASLL